MSYPRLPDGRYFTTADWELIEERRTPARGRKYRGGQNIETVYKNRHTGELVTRHRIEKEGKIAHHHFRPGGLKT